MASQDPSSARHDQPSDLNPTGRFSDRADDYKKYRPSYPREAIDAIVEGLGAPALLVGADVGAGTGISSVLLAERGVKVFAVEPNPAMRNAATPHAGITWVEGTAEATTLARDSMDLLLCAQAFHWFRAPEALAEFRRVLRPGGRLILMWNDRDETDPLTAAYGRAIEEAADKSPGFFDHTRAETFMESPLFGDQRERVFRYAQPHDKDGLIGRALSASYIPKSGAASDRLVQRLSEIHGRFADANGMVQLRYNTKVFMGEKRRA
jgi:SAM-dependent methyltransferase